MHSKALGLTDCLVSVDTLLSASMPGIRSASAEAPIGLVPSAALRGHFILEETMLRTFTWALVALITITAAQPAFAGSQGKEPDLRETRSLAAEAYERTEKLQRQGYRLCRELEALKERMVADEEALKAWKAERAEKAKQFAEWQEGVDNTLARYDAEIEDIYSTLQAYFVAHGELDKRQRDHEDRIRRLEAEVTYLEPQLNVGVQFVDPRPLALLSPAQPELGLSFLLGHENDGFGVAGVFSGHNAANGAYGLSVGARVYKLTSSTFAIGVGSGVYFEAYRARNGIFAGGTHVADSKGLYLEVPLRFQPAEKFRGYLTPSVKIGGGGAADGTSYWGVLPGLQLTFAMPMGI